MRPLPISVLGKAAKRHVRPLVIINPHPVAGVLLNFGDAVEQIMSQPIVADRTVIAFDVGILLWIPGLDMHQFKAPSLRPLRQRVTNVSGPLSLRMARGFPRHSITFSSVRTTRSAGKDRSTSIAKASRL